jgi:hypothetical protein
MQPARILNNTPAAVPVLFGYDTGMQTMNIKQCAQYAAVVHLKIGRLNVKPGDSFTVTSPTYKNQETVKVDRTARAKLNIGKLLAVEDFLQYFILVD